MENLAQRLQKIISYYGLNAGAFAQQMEIQKSSISHLLSGRNKPSFLFLNKLSKNFPEINIKWFITGTGNMIENKNVKKEIEIPQKNSNKGTKINQFEENNKSINTTKENELPQQLIMVFDDDTFKILNNRKI